MHIHKVHSSEQSDAPQSPQLPEEPRVSGPIKRPRVTFRPSAAFGWLFATFILATGPLEYAVADQSGSAYFSAAALGGLALMGALLLAELRRARRLLMAGVKVDRVEVGLLRARSITSGELQTPGSLRRVSWAGPLTLGGVAILLAGVGGLLYASSSIGLSLLGATALFTAIGVASLALTELIPAPGSPGSELIFAREWRRSGQRDAALTATAKAGIVSGWFLVVAGIAVVTFLSFAGVWLAFIGFAVMTGSRLTLAGAKTRQRLSGLQARHVMASAPPEVSSFATAGAAFTDVAMPSRAPLLIVREPDGSFGGIVSATALAAVPGDDRELTRVRRLAIAPSELPTVTVSEPMEKVLEVMAQHPLAGVTVVLDEPADALTKPAYGSEQPLVAGIITAADIAHTLQLMDAANPSGRGGNGRRSEPGVPSNPWTRS